MRFFTLPTLTILTGGLLAAADSATVTYIDGNIADLSPNTGATLYLNNSQSMELKTPLHKVQIPYRPDFEGGAGLGDSSYARTGTAVQGLGAAQAAHEVRNPADDRGLHEREAARTRP